MRHVAPSNSVGLAHTRDTSGLSQTGPAPFSETVPYRSMVDTAVPAPTLNAKAPWAAFSSHDYWSHNYEKVLPEDQEIIGRISSFFIKTFRSRSPVRRAIDVGSGTNLYPALLMLPWAKQILLSDYSESNVDWLRGQVAGEGPWTWQPFWGELYTLEGYDQVSEPHRHLREACGGRQQHSGIEQLSVFDLPPAQWQLGTMFFVAESITADRAEFAEAVGRFVGALEPHSPFAAAFMSGSKGYTVKDTRFPAVSVRKHDITKNFTRLNVSDLNVDLLKTSPTVRDGYEGMIVATGITGDH